MNFFFYLYAGSTLKSIIQMNIYSHVERKREARYYIKLDRFTSKNLNESNRSGHDKRN